MQPILKLIGSLLILICCSSASISVSAHIKKEVAELGAFIALVRHIRLEISCFSKPLTDIYMSFESKPLISIGFMEGLREGGFTYAIERTEGKMSLTQRQKDLLYQFADSLGKGYREDELNACDYFISALEEEYRNSVEVLPKKNKLTRSLCFLFGISIIIILI